MANNEQNTEAQIPAPPFILIKVEESNFEKSLELFQKKTFGGSSAISKPAH